MDEEKNLHEQENSSISYSGNVSLKFIRNNRVIKRVNVKNRGYQRLFDYITNCLCLNYVQGAAPTHLILYCDNALEKDSLKNTYMFNGSGSSAPIRRNWSWHTDNTQEASIEFSITPSDIVGDVVTHIALFDEQHTSSENAAVDYYQSEEVPISNFAHAIIELNEDDQIKKDEVSLDTIILLTWTLSFDNSTAANS